MSEHNLCAKCGNLTYHDGECVRCGEGSPEQQRIKELEQENAELKARDRLHTAMFADADTCLKLKQQVLQYSRERAEANRAELEAKQRVWVLERENAHLRRVRDAAECLLDENEGFSLFNNPDTGEYELSVLADDLLKKLRDALQGKDGE